MVWPGRVVFGVAGPGGAWYSKAKHGRILLYLKSDKLNIQTFMLQGWVRRGTVKLGLVGCGDA